MHKEPQHQFYTLASEKTIKVMTNNNNGGGGVTSVGRTIYPSPPLSNQSAIIQPNQGPCFARSPPGLLVKTYAMVDDPDTNYIISWSLSGTSFIIWDHIKLAQEILPKYFKHNNFTSFIMQLNNYGFRKIDLEKWEYENQWFQRGKKQLLLNIKRRDSTPRVLKQRFSRKRSIDVASYEINNTQLETLRNHAAVFKEEIQKLKEQQSCMHDKIALFKEQIRVTKDNSMKLITFLGKAFGGIIFKDVTQQIEEETVCKENGEIAENVLTSDTDHSSINNHMMEVNNDIPEANASGSYQEDTLWKKFLEIDGQEVSEFEQEFVKNQYMLDMELEDMMEAKIALITENESKTHNMNVGHVDLPLWT